MASACVAFSTSCSCLVRFGVCRIAIVSVFALADLGSWAWLRRPVHASRRLDDFVQAALDRLRASRLDETVVLWPAQSMLECAFSFGHAIGSSASQDLSVMS